MAQAMQVLLALLQGVGDQLGQACRARLSFETDNELSVINGEYAGSETGGMFGSEYLLRDIESFTYHFVAHQRSKETNVKDVISLANEYPLAFGEFLESGKMSFETTLRDFDVRHPGLYGQRVQAVELEVIGLISPEGIRGTLRAGGASRYRTADGAEKTRVHTLDTMALSSSPSAVTGSSTGRTRACTDSSKGRVSRRRGSSTCHGAATTSTTG